MSDELIGALGRWIDNPEFRADVVKFLSLSQDAVDKLVALIEKHATFDVPASEIAEFKNACGLDGNGRGILAAARLIRSSVRRIDQDERRESLINFAALVGVESFVPEYFSAFFSALPELDNEELRTSAIAIAPTLADISLNSDLRVVSDPKVECRLVPVVFARLEFDEPVAGQRALFIQITEDSLEELEQEIKKTKEILQIVRSRFGLDILARGDGQ
ncbi:MAG: hypothetical protein F4Y63_06215 [Chloroflexi bacterium]|nr:hypothetical protein [Chloroflexota bacterium]